MFIGDANNVYIRYNKTEKVRMFVECKEGSGQGLFNWYVEQNDVDLVQGGTFHGIEMGVNTVNPITPVAFAHATDCKVINCTFKNFNTWHNIEFNGCSYCYADYCKFYNYGLTSGGSPTEVVQIDYCGSSDQYPWNCNYDNTSCDHV